MDCQGLPAMASSSKVGLSEPEPEEHHQNTFFEFVVPGVLLNGVGLLGLVGNILSIIVLSRPQMKSSINCILIGRLGNFLLICTVNAVHQLSSFFNAESDDSGQQRLSLSYATKSSLFSQAWPVLTPYSFLPAF